MSNLSQKTERQGCSAASAGRSRKAFSLVEILVTVTLLSFIILGLLMMFNQTQKAFKLSMTQVDVLESGRMVTDILSRELEQATASREEPSLHTGGTYQTTNFFTELANNFAVPTLQGLPGSALNGNQNVQDRRTNIIQHFFFMRHEGPEWIGIGYAVIQPTVQSVHLGSLYRFSFTNHPPFVNENMSWIFRNEIGVALTHLNNGWPITNMSRIADGVVHMRVRPFALNGQPLMTHPDTTNLVFRLPDGTYRPVRNSYGALRSANGMQLDHLDSYFVYDALPGQLELELGFLEQNALERYKGLEGNEPAQRAYLSNHTANVHIFRQRIPVRNVDLSVYQ